MQYGNYEIVVKPNSNTYEIHSVGKGALPDMLKGGYTSVGHAKKKIDQYREIRNTK